MKTIIVTKAVNTIAVEAKKGQTFEMVKEFENSFRILVEGKERMISKKFAKLQEKEITPKKRSVIASVIKHLREGSKTKQMLAEILETEFPERTKESMLKTLNAQLGFATGKPARIEIEQKVSLKTERIGKVVFFEIAL